MNKGISVLFAVLAVLFATSVVCGEQSPLQFKRVMVIVLENQDLWVANLNSDLMHIAKKGTLLTNYKATTHPSQPNYISIIGGETLGVKGDGHYDVDGKNLVDLMEEKGVSWKAYNEDYPGNCFASDSGKYKRKHNPFISFNNIRNDKDRCAKIVNADEMWKDLENGNFPQFAFYTPNMNNDGHDTGIIHAGKWAKEFIHKLSDYNTIRDETLVVLTFDEGLMIGANLIYTVLIGPQVPMDNFDHTRYTHYSLLRTIEDNFGLGTLGRHDEKATPFLFKNNPPSFMLTVPIFSLIVAGGAVFVIVVVTVSFFLIRRQVRRKRSNAVNKDIENKPNFEHLQENDPEHA